MVSVDWRVIVYKQSAHGGRECGRGTSAGHRNWAFISQHPVLPSAWVASGVFPISPGRTAAAPSYSFSFWRVLSSRLPCWWLNSSSVDCRGAILPKPPEKLRRASGGRAGGIPSACSAPPPSSSCRTTPLSADGCWLCLKSISGELAACLARRWNGIFTNFCPARYESERGTLHLSYWWEYSARGVNRGIELANKIRAPGLLILLLILVAYALVTGDVSPGLSFAFAPDFGRLSPNVVLAAVGQAFFATGVGMGMMLAYGAYVPRGASLIRAALVISGSIVLVSLLATLMIFPLVYRYGLNPAQGAELVFNVLPTVFWEMPGGRMVGILFFLLLVLAALTPSLAGLEPMVAWLVQRRGLSRSRAAFVAAAGVWVLGIGSVLSFNAWAHWSPFAGIARLRNMTVFDVLDFVSSNLMLPIGALLTCTFIGWRLPRSLVDGELPEETAGARRFLVFLLRYVCPLGIAAILVTVFA